MLYYTNMLRSNYNSLYNCYMLDTRKYLYEYYTFLQRIIQPKLPCRNKIIKMVLCGCGKQI